MGEFTWGDPKRGGTGKYGDPIRVTAEPILTEQEFASLQDALRRKATGRPLAPTRLYPLSGGRLMCFCGEPYGGVFRHDRELRQYRCRASKWTTTGAPRCRARRIDADWVESTVWNEIVALLCAPERLMACVADYLGLRSGQVAAERDETVAIDTKITRLERALTRASKDTLLADEPATYQQVTAEIRAELQTLRVHLARLETWREESSREAARMRDLWTLAETAAKQLPQMNPAEKAEVIALLDVRVMVLDEPPAAPARGGRKGGYGPVRPRLRIDGVVPHAKLLADVPGNPAVHRIPGVPRPQ